MEAISHAGTCVGLLGQDGVVLAAEKKVTSKLLEPLAQSEKMYRIDDHIGCAVAGITSDANILVNYARETAQRYTFSYQEPEPVEQLVRSLCDLKQGYTQFGGQRPFGVSMLYAGWDKHFGFQLYQSDPSGNYGGWKATSIGSGNASAASMLKSDYKPELTVAECLQFAVKILAKTIDSSALNHERLEFATLTKKADGRLSWHMLTPKEIDDLIKATPLEPKEDENK